MTQYEFCQDSQGRYHRLSIEQKADVHELARFQYQLKQDITGFRPKIITDLHVTYLHLGRPDELFAELQAVNPNLTFEYFHGSIQSVLQAGRRAVRPVVVIKLAHNQAWLRQRQSVIHALYGFLLDCSIADPRQFIRASPNLRYGDEDMFSPHLTLGTAPRNATVSQVKFQPMKIELGPTIIRGASQSDN